MAESPDRKLHITHWVDCPTCGEPDMKKEDGVVFCTNEACPSRLPVETVVSGGQTGVDEAALIAAKSAYIKTGGWMPATFRTDEGPRPEFAELYGMKEHSSFSYPPRTKLNVVESDGTLILGNDKSPGCKLTKKLCRENGKPFLVQSFTADDRPDLIRAWIKKNGIKVLNVAGNRESTNPGIGAWAVRLLRRTFGIDTTEGGICLISQ